MSTKILGLLLGEVFGEDVERVAKELLEWNGQSLPTLLRSGDQKTVKACLAVLIQHNIVTFSKSLSSPRVEYTLHHDNTLNLIRYSRYLVLAKTLFGDEGEVISEEIFSNGRDSCSNVLFRAAKRLQGTQDSLATTVKRLLDTFKEMVACHFIRRVDSPYLDVKSDVGMSKIPELACPENLKYCFPQDFDSRFIVSSLSKDEESLSNKVPDGKIHWRLDHDRFLREFRDQIIIQAVTKRIDSSAGNLMRVLLELSNEVHPWASVSGHIHLMDITSRIDKSPKDGAVGSDKRLAKFQDQYVKVLEEDRTRFIDRVGDAGGGQYVVNLQHILSELVAATADSIVLEKFGSKALRIFRVIRQKLHVEESQLQGFVMIPAKEVKLLTYQLLENNFIQIEELRKSMAANNNAPSKCFYLYYVDMNQVARMIHDMSLKAMANSYTRKNHESNRHLRLLDKQEKIDSICTNLKQNGEIESSEELQLQLQEIQDMLSPAERETVKKAHERIDQLSRACGQVDETLLVISLYLRYQRS